MANAAVLEGRTPPVLYTVARDGALHSFVYDRPADAPAAAPMAGSDDDEADGGSGAVEPPAAFTGDCILYCAMRSTAGSFDEDVLHVSLDVP